MKSAQRTWVDFGLWILLATGFYGAVSVSLDNLTGTPCPHVLMVPVCYAVLIGYALMVLSVIVNHNSHRHHLFAIGWSIATAIAAVGSIAEVFAGGGVCPTSGGSNHQGATTPDGIPLCYVSLALLLGILLLYILGPCKRACNNETTTLEQ